MAFGKKEAGAHAAAANSGKRAKRAQKPLSPKEKKRRILLVVLALVAAALCATAAAVAFFQRPELPDPVTKEEEFGELTGPKLSGDRKEDFFTFLVIGRDTGGGGNTDTVLLAAYDVKNQEMNVMSIPRDTMVNVNWDVKKINSVYNFNGGGDDGIKALYKEVSELVGFVPDYSVVVEWEAVGELVDAIGGVWYDVPRNMDYEDPSQNLSIHVQKGYQKLNGEQAMGVVRFREGKNGYANGDLGRIETQQGFLKALIGQCLQIDKMTKVFEYARIFTEQVTTDLTINNLAWFGQQAIFGGLTSENVNFITMPCTTKSVWSRSYHANLSYVVPNVDELVQVVNESFNPYLDDLSSSELDIMYVNSDGTIACTSGRLQDSKANSSIGSRPGNNHTQTVDPDTTKPVEPDVPVEPEPAPPDESSGIGVNGGNTGTGDGSTGDNGGNTGTGDGGSGENGGNTGTGDGGSGNNGGNTGTGDGGSGDNGGNTGTGDGGSDDNGGNTGTGDGGSGDNGGNTSTGDGGTGGSDSTGNPLPPNGNNAVA
ncbi:MAG: LCP family protein [Clostridiales bacterium]|nr:LCP family protein [Clostridiales bacterium]MDY4036967.1 LCP family protein [Candidatus Pseudoscilispira sp.]